MSKRQDAAKIIVQKMSTNEYVLSCGIDFSIQALQVKPSIC